ncbi:alpha/beta fold hydrolase [Flavobacterium sp.]|uniref:alpha/beta fold hydrolase n=1 Tax=Flavobacterium sp. TaxID=239 RepID=UPI0039E4B6E9
MQDILLLHGAIGAKQQFDALVQSLEKRYKVHTLNFSGHGGAAIGNDFSIAQFASETLDYLDANQIDAIKIFGYSMGGYVALYLAKMHPQRIDGIFTLATKFEWTPEIAARETKMLNPEKIAEKIPAFAAELQQRHAPNDWKTVMAKTAEMMIGLGDNNPLQLEDYQAIQIPTRIAIGDKDQMVTLEETIAVYRSLPHASLVVLPQTQHPIEKVSVERLVSELGIFFG